MNDLTPPSSTASTKPQGHVKGRLRKPAIPLEDEVYCRIASKLKELSLQVGYEVSMSKFLRRTIVESWEQQIERYYKRPPVMKNLAE
jgi:hypothetical protein